MSFFVLGVGIICNSFMTGDDAIDAVIKSLCISVLLCFSGSIAAVASCQEKAISVVAILSFVVMVLVTGFSIMRFFLSS